jgi:hypothetical protein
LADPPRSNPVLVPPRATPAQEPPTLQQRRAAEPGRGRHAHVLQRIPRPGWKDILVRTYREILDDRLLALAAGVAFYSLIALFPAIAAGVSSYALFANAATISKHLAIAADIVPTGGLDILRDEITRIAAARALALPILARSAIRATDRSHLPVALASSRMTASTASASVFRRSDIEDGTTTVAARNRRPHTTRRMGLPSSIESP